LRGKSCTFDKNLMRAANTQAKVYCLAKRKGENYYVPTPTPVPNDLAALQKIRGWKLYLGGKRYSHGQLEAEFLAGLKAQGESGVVLGGVVPCRDIGRSKKQAFRDLRRTAITLTWLDMTAIRALGDVVGVEPNLTRAATRDKLIRNAGDLCKAMERSPDLDHVEVLMFLIDGRVTADVEFLTRHKSVVYALVRADVEILAATQVPGTEDRPWDARPPRL